MFGDMLTLTSFVVASKKVLPSTTLYVTTSMMSGSSASSSNSGTMEDFQTALVQATSTNNDGINYASNVVMSQVVSSPWEQSSSSSTTTTNSKLVQAFRNALQTYLSPSTTTTTTSYFTVAAMEGYVVGKFVVAILQRMVMNSTASSSFSRSNFLSTIFDSSTVTLAGISGLHLGEFTSTSTTPCNQGLRQVYVNSDFLANLGLLFPLIPALPLPPSLRHHLSFLVAHAIVMLVPCRSILCLGKPWH